ncbi:MAG: queuosine precursor transporter [Candidatus Pacebacteria bacterium]|nr:queuosine precursor transporter [Candidatus Paceibacterota bacterium]
MKTKFNKMEFLVALYITCLALAEIMSMKTIPLFKIFNYQLNVSVGIFVFPILFAINDVIAEVKGRARAQQLVYTGLVMVAFIMIYSIFVTWLPESNRFSDGQAYNAIFAKAARISLASLLAFLISGLLDVALFHKIKVKTQGKMLWLRSNLSNFISQLLDTFIFTSVAFYSFQDGLATNFNFIMSIVIPYWLLKCFMSVVETPLTYWGVKWLAKK